MTEKTATTKYTLLGARSLRKNIHFEIWKVFLSFYLAPSLLIALHFKGLNFDRAITPSAKVSINLVDMQILSLL